MDSAASRLLSQARSNRRSGVPGSGGGAKHRQFTLDRHKAKEIEEQAVKQSLVDFLSEETATVLTGDLLDELASGVVLCKLVARFGQVVRFKAAPGNEFQRLENFRLFGNACADLGLSVAAPTGRLPLKLAELLPCLLALAARAEMNAGLQAPAQALVEPAAQAAASPQQTPSQPVGRAETPISAGTSTSTPPLRRLTDADYLADGESDVDDIEDMNAVLKGLHDLRMARQRQMPPKLRMVNVGAAQLLVVERPGESVGSILWNGAAILASVLNDVAQDEFNQETKVLELGAGVGLVGIWCACRGSDVVVTELEGNSLDLLWSNVAANAQAIVKAGGACSARALDWNDVYKGQKLVDFGADAKRVVVVAADCLYNETVEPLTNLVAGLFAVRSDLVFYIAWKPRASETEQVFFDRLINEHGVGFDVVAERDEHKVFRGSLRRA